MRRKNADNFNMEKNWRSNCKVYKMIFFAACLLFSQVFAQVYKERTVASFYGADFHGKLTSNGETFDMNDLTCANKFLPFGTVLKVTNLANNLSVIVRVNDRGPFVEGREIDLSKAAAEKLGMIKSGTAQVKIEIVKLGENTKLSLETAKKACEIMERKTGKKYEIPNFNGEKKIAEKKYPAGSYWEICVASFSERKNATKTAIKLHGEGFKNIVFQKKGDVTRVVLKEIPANQMKSIEDKLQKNGYKNYLVKEIKK